MAGPNRDSWQAIQLVAEDLSCIRSQLPADALAVSIRAVLRVPTLSTGKAKTSEEAKRYAGAESGHVVVIHLVADGGFATLIER